MKHRALIEKMTLEEKAGLCSGADFWRTKSIKRLGIPSIMMTDGPHGLRKQLEGGDYIGIGESTPATCFPSAAAIANSWDENLLWEMGHALGKEAAAEQVALVLGPGVNIKRSPLCGRNFEYFSEDPFLSGRLGVAYIKGMQDCKVGACVKHFAANNQETRRMTINTVVDERALREIYLPAFEMCVKEAAPQAVMSAYNRLNGAYCTENPWLMDVLKKEWGFDGIVVTDWGAENDRVEGLLAGNELEMPCSQGEGDARIVGAVRSGRLDESILDARVDRLLEFILRAAENGHAAPERPASCDTGAHHLLATKLAEAAVVLLKNEDGILPLKNGIQVAVIGDLAETPRYQGSGSSTIRPTRLHNAHDCLVEAFGTIHFAKGYFRHITLPNALLIRQACDIAEGKDVVLLFAGLTEMNESESMDRGHLDLPDCQNDLIEAVCAVNPNVIVVLSGGAPFLMPWLGKVKAVVNGYLGGQAGGQAIVNILTGKADPAGKLAETWPLSLSDTPAYGHFPGTAESVEYRESIFVGYRHYDSVGKEVLFPFGYGLSYTSFSYGDLQIVPTSDSCNAPDAHCAVETATAACEAIDARRDSPSASDAAPCFSVTFTIRNTGRTAGAETAQLYVSHRDSVVAKPVKELKGFAKVRLEPGEEARVTLPLAPRAFAHYDVGQSRWVVEPGLYHILIGSSCRDIRLEGAVPMGNPPAVTERPIRRIRTNAAGVTDAEFETLLGTPIPPNAVHVGILTENNTLEQARERFLAGLLYRFVIFFFLRPAERRGHMNKAMMAQSILQLPFRGYARMSDGAVSTAMLEGFLVMLNGRFFKGIGQLIRATVTKKHRRGEPAMDIRERGL